MWTDYKKTFPVQYINLGYFDEYVRQVVLEKKPKLILDVGGGIASQNKLRHVYLLILSLHFRFCKCYYDAY